ncbi:MAG: glutamate racemase [Chlamydiae bacterium]|nr:glutamate racemase [Chlamydiota bacterium]
MVESPNCDLPIGVFDSGFGGLTVMKQLAKLLPYESIVYLGDSARLPYGNKSPEVIQSYSSECCQFLYEQNVKLIVIACHTASSYACFKLNEKLNIPVIGMIDPCLSDFLSSKDKSKILILATQATIDSQVYQKAIQQLSPSTECLAVPCPLFAPLVEEGFTTGPIVQEVMNFYLKPIKNLNMNTAILGCTHYPLLKPEIKNYLNPNCEIIDPGVSCAKYVRDFLKNNALISTQKKTGNHFFYTTDDPEKFKLLGARFLGSCIPEIKKVWLK